MDLRDYCHSVEVELIGWKARMYDIVRKLDKLGTAERGKIVPNVEDLHIIIEDMDDRINALRTECPTEWSPIRKKIDEAHVDMRSKYEAAMEAIGKAAPVSVGG